jgi:Family of unknown function (DUF6335)
MAKRKAARAKGRKAASARGSAGRSNARAKAAGRKSARKAGRTSAGAKRARTATARRSSGAASRKATARKAPARKTAAKKTVARKAPARSAPAARGASPKALPARKLPNLNRERRIVQDDDTVVSVPSSLDLDRRASAARTGRRELRQRFNEHTETSPQLTGGDVDADWESAYSVGDEAPGGDNPTPDQDIVDDIGRAVGVEYQDNEELKGADKVAKRDKHRWELDPASSEDYDDRD